MDACIHGHGWVGGWMDGRMGGWVGGWMEGWMSGRMSGWWVGGLIDGSIHGWMGGLMGGRMQRACKKCTFIHAYPSKPLHLCEAERAYQRAELQLLRRTHRQSIPDSTSAKRLRSTSAHQPPRLPSSTSTHRQTLTSPPTHHVAVCGILPYCIAWQHGSMGSMV